MPRGIAASCSLPRIKPHGLTDGARPRYLGIAGGAAAAADALAAGDAPAAGVAEADGDGGGGLGSGAGDWVNVTDVITRSGVALC